MSDRTRIEWCDATWNPVDGCTKIAVGCRNCYAESMARRFWGARQFSQVRYHPERLRQPLAWRKPRRVFVCSMGDLFHGNVADHVIFAIWRTMGLASQHTFLVLTKQASRMRQWMAKWADAGPWEIPPVMWREGEHSDMVTDADAERLLSAGRAKLFHEWVLSLGGPPPGCAPPVYDWLEGERWWPTILPNVWLGVSLEDRTQ